MKICHRELLKIAQSSHTGAKQWIFGYLFVVHRDHVSKMPRLIVKGQLLGYSWETSHFQH